jgi:alkylation response protein AidB-like acyl-CoA dehydrogenase
MGPETGMTNISEISGIVAQPASGSSNIPDSRGINFFTSDPDFARLLRLHLGDGLYRELEGQFVSLGRRASDELDVWALSADKNPPQLRHRTRRGEALQSIDKHPDYVALERVAYAELGLASMSHGGHDSRSGKTAPPPLVKYALTFLFVQAEFGLCCPVSMTDSLTRTLRKFGAPELVARFLPMLASRDFDTLFQGAMFMTEQAAGSDVARIATRASRMTAANGDVEWRLSGDKWFCSNADADLAMVLARPDDAPPGINGLGLFLLPKTLPDGSRNSYRIVRLKDKLGSRSMASGEIVLEGAVAYLIGEVGRGFHQMADMINMSRLSNGVRAAGLMRRALTEALHIARRREAFGRKLIDMPLMQRQLLKMMLPAEQARSMFIRIAQLLPLADADDRQAAKCVRILTPLIKFRACRDARRVTGDAMEVRGGTGYIEEWSDARLVRDAHLGSIWEGTSNIVALDIARAAKRDGALEPLRNYLNDLLGAAGLPAQSLALLRWTLTRACDALASVAESGRDEYVRQAGSALYHASTAVLMACEGVQLAPDYRRLALAHLVVRHKLLPSDPLDLHGAEDDIDVIDALVDGRDITLDQAMQLLPAGAAQ